MKTNKDYRRIIGLDLGTTSIGWAVVDEATNSHARSTIVKAGVRIVSLSTDEENDFKKGKAISINANRTLKRGARRNLQRYKQRRAHLAHVLKQHKIIGKDFQLPEVGKKSTHQLWKLRAKAAEEEISRKDFVRVLFALNKKRGYKSNRKAKEDGEGTAIDGMALAKKMKQEQLTPGQVVLQHLKKGKKGNPDFYPSDLREEFEAIINQQAAFYPALITGDFKDEIAEKSSKATYAICDKHFKLEGIKQTGSREEKKLELYQWRVKGLFEKLGLEELTFVLQEINKQINSSSGYLGAISDRSKELYFNNQTIGQYLYAQLKENKHNRLKGQVFYRQDYQDEFEKIWEVQAENRKEVFTDDLKDAIRNTIIFYQRRLKSQKGLISICELEGVEKEVKREGKQKKIMVGPRVVPRSSPLFQEYKVWQKLNDIEFIHKKEQFRQKIKEIDSDVSIRNALYDRLLVAEKLSDSEILKISEMDAKTWELNYKNGIEGNLTNAKLFKAYRKIAELSGHEVNHKAGFQKQAEALREVFKVIGIDESLVDFDSTLEFDKATNKNRMQEQPYYQLWHLLYSFEEDMKRGMEPLYDTLANKYGIVKNWAKPLVQLSFSDDHGNLSAKAIGKILPSLKQGIGYADAAAAAGYNHSHSVTKAERDSSVPDSQLELLPKNSLRNPVVEKILNQMVNVVNAIIKEYGKPDEIRIELARELKKNAKERSELTSAIGKAKTENEKIKKELRKLYPFNQGIRITRNDIVKYKLYQELAFNGYKTLYTNTYVPKEELFSKKFDIEHIIPQTKLFDDSFSNKTLSLRSFNENKGNATAFDYLIEHSGGEDSERFKAYLDRVETFFKQDLKRNKAKYTKLRMKESEIPDGFIERDLRNSQYIAKKSVELLKKICKNVVPTTGAITARLREDWQLINVLKELNLKKFEKQGLIKVEETKDGKQIKLIEKWSKRNDHRHHAMDAITVAFTKHNHIQYFNYLNARKDGDHKKHANIHAIEQLETTRNENNRRIIKPPIPLVDLRREVKDHLEYILVSHKPKNKVVTKNKNQIKGKKKPQEAMTPRDQLHKETVYGKSKTYVSKEEKVSTKFDEATIKKVAKKKHREALLNRLNEFNNDPKKAFGGKNAIHKNPVYLNKDHQEKVPGKVKLSWFEDRFTIRKEITPANFKTEKNIEKVVDKGAKQLLLDRLEESDGDANKAFSNLEEQPIWLDKDKGVRLKRVTISGVSNAEPLHYKKDQFGLEIKDEEGNPIPTDFVSTGNNHHIAIYEDEEGNIFDYACSFSDAVKRTTYKLPIIPKDTSKLWDQVMEKEIEDTAFLENLPKSGLQLKYSMKQNECFVFPNKETAFNPSEIDLTDDDLANQISPNLYRVQKFSKLTYGKSSVREYVFRHHLETNIEEKKELKEITFKNIKSLPHLEGIQKVRLNHLGKIVQVGEY
jgi:CRISPR-associated endonuclease Csn1